MPHSDTSEPADSARPDEDDESPIHDEVDQDTDGPDDPLAQTEGLSASEAAALRRVRGLSDLLDDAIPIPGTDFRIGLDPILGLLPVAGDAVSAALSLYPVAEAYRFGASRRTLAKMLGLVGIDAAIGSIPVIGDVFDAFWKANEWNARTLERLVQGE